MPELDITNGFYISDSLPISHQECTNWFVNIVQSGGLSQRTLFGTPGITKIATTGDDLYTERNRGSWVKNGIPYFVNGETLYKLERAISSGAEVFQATALGTVVGENRVSMASNDTQLMILVPGSTARGYIYNEDAGTPFQQITDADFDANGVPQIVVFVDGYFACTTDTKKWIVSALNDGLSWNALDFGTAESDPDAVVAPVVLNNQVYITGTETTEGNQNVPSGSGFPFQRNNIFLDKGCFAPFSIIKTNQRFFMIGGGKNESPSIWEFTGNNYAKISTTAIDNVLKGYTDEEVSTAFAWSYAQKGAFFVGFTFPDRSFVYDMMATALSNRPIWHERKSVIESATSKKLTQWRVASMVTAYGKVLVGDLFDGRIGELDPDEYGEYGEDIIRPVSFQPFSAGGNPIRIPILELTMESGVGNADVPDPKISLAISRDAKTFKYERVRKIGEIGKYQQRIFWRKNGRYPRLVVFRLLLSDQVKPVIIKLEVP
jgi:hypothetical protein